MAANAIGLIFNQLSHFFAYLYQVILAFSEEPSSSLYTGTSTDYCKGLRNFIMTVYCALVLLGFSLPNFPG